MSSHNLLYGIPGEPHAVALIHLDVSGDRSMVEGHSIHLDLPGLPGVNSRQSRVERMTTLGELGFGIGVELGKEFGLWTGRGERASDGAIVGMAAAAVDRTGLELRGHFEASLDDALRRRAPSAPGPWPTRPPFAALPQAAGLAMVSDHAWIHHNVIFAYADQRSPVGMFTLRVADYGMIMSCTSTIPVPEGGDDAGREGSAQKVVSLAIELGLSIGKELGTWGVICRPATATVVRAMARRICSATRLHPLDIFEAGPVAAATRLGILMHRAPATPRPSLPGPGAVWATRPGPNGASRPS